MTVKEIRSKTGLSRSAFSAKYGIPVRTIEDWEAGKRTPPEYVARLLSYAVEQDSKAYAPARLHLIDRKTFGESFISELYRSDDYEISVLTSDGTTTLKASPLKSWLPEIHMSNGDVTKIGFVGDVILEDRLEACAEGLKNAPQMISMLREKFF